MRISSPSRRDFSNRYCRWAVALSLLVVSTRGAAQTPNDAAAKNAARTLAQSGKTRFEAGDFAGALQALEEAEKYFRAPTITRMRALTLEKLGRLTEAKRVHRQLVDEKLPERAPPEFVRAQEESQKSLESLETRIPRLRISLAHAPLGTKVTLDGSPLDPAASEAVRVDPGKHTVEVTPPSGEKLSRDVDLAEQADERIAFDLAPAPRTAPTSAPSAAPVPTSAAVISIPPSKAEPESKRSFLGPGIAFGVGGAALIVGAVTGGLTIAKRSEVDTLCDEHRECPKDLEQKLDLDQANSVAHVSTVAFAVAGVGLATGTLLLLLPRPVSSKPVSRGSTSIEVSAGSLVIRGSF